MPNSTSEPDGADAQLEQGVDPQRVPPARDQARQQQAAQAHAAHERPQQHAEGNGGRADHQLQELEPDDLVDQAPHSRCRRTARAARAGTVAARPGRSVGSGRVGSSRGCLRVCLSIDGPRDYNPARLNIQDVYDPTRRTSLGYGEQETHPSPSRRGKIRSGEGASSGVVRGSQRKIRRQRRRSSLNEIVGPSRPERRTIAGVRDHPPGVDPFWLAWKIAAARL